MTSSATRPKATARERLLEAANELFYLEGVQSVGIDRVIEHAGVAKASLYNSFGSKEELVHAYLEGRRASTAARITAAVEKRSTPRDKLLAIFESQSEAQRRPGFRGCAFAAASAEAKPGGLVEQATTSYRGWLLGLFRDLAAETGAPRPELLGRQLQLLYDGAASAGTLDHDSSAAASARAAAEVLIDASLDARP